MYPIFTPVENTNSLYLSMLVNKIRIVLCNWLIEFPLNHNYNEYISMLKRNQNRTVDMTENLTLTLKNLYVP